MSSSLSSIPKWLEVSPPHLQSVVHALAKRERTRENARAASRRRADPSRTHRTAYIPTTLFSSSGDFDYYSVAVGCHPNNQPFNRYIELEPYDRTRIVVGTGDRTISDDIANTGSSGRYLNGSWVRERMGGKWWIATQAPLPHTAHAFLSILAQPTSRPPTSLLPMELGPSIRTSRVRTVVQLTQTFENGRQKAHDYFPATVGQSWSIPAEVGSLTLPPLKVTLFASEFIKEAQCIRSTVSISSDPHSEPIIFRHMLYNAWPDHGVPEPEDRASLLAFLRLVDRTNKDLSSHSDSADLDPGPPIMVGCSAGIGRTGAFIALSSLLRAHNLMSQHTPPSSIITSPTPHAPLLPVSPLGSLPDKLQDDLVAQEIDSLREQRPGMVQREEQILLIYEILAEAFLRVQNSPGS